jgi:hypothetical protein
MTADEFRRLVLELPDVVEGEHMNHPDFRLGGKIFATLGSPDASFGMVKLTPEQQQLFVSAAPEMFEPAQGGWGRSGSTLVRLGRVSATLLHDALTAAWHSAAAKKSAARAGANTGVSARSKIAEPANAVSKKAPARKSTRTKQVAASAAAKQSRTAKTTALKGTPNKKGKSAK